MKLISRTDKKINGRRFNGALIELTRTSTFNSSKLSEKLWEKYPEFYNKPVKVLSDEENAKDYYERNGYKMNIDCSNFIYKSEFKTFSSNWLSFEPGSQVDIWAGWACAADPSY